jgi:hypothetical protein
MKPVVVGLYGISGCGNSFLLSQLKEELKQEQFEFYDGSAVIFSLDPGGLDTFRKLEEPQKDVWRQNATEKIRAECAESGRVGVVAGHLSFWTREGESGRSVVTQNDLDTFTHILYLHVPAALISTYRKTDANRIRSSLSVDHLHKWQEAEMTELRKLCRHHGILFSTLTPHLNSIDKVAMFLRDFKRHSEDYNLICAHRSLDEAVAGRSLETMLVIDGDKTLASVDTGSIFWEMVAEPQTAACPLKALFISPLHYKYAAFRQATVLYEETTDDEQFE